MIKEKVLECLYQLGFQPELVNEDFGYRFSYEDLTILYNPEEESQCLTFSMPGIFDISEDNRITVLEAMVKLCAKMRFVQPVIMFNSVWLNYQHYLDKDTEPTVELLEHMVRVLAFSMIQFHKIINNEEEE